MTFNVITRFLCLSVAIGKAINDGLPKCNSDNMHTLIAISLYVSPLYLLLAETLAEKYLEG